MRYPTKTNTKESCDSIATSIARYEKYRCWASKGILLKTLRSLGKSIFTNQHESSRIGEEEVGNYGEEGFGSGGGESQERESYISPKRKFSGQITPGTSGGHPGGCPWSKNFGQALKTTTQTSILERTLLLLNYYRQSCYS